MINSVTASRNVRARLFTAEAKGVEKERERENKIDERGTPVENDVNPISVVERPVVCLPSRESVARVAKITRASVSRSRLARLATARYPVNGDPSGRSPRRRTEFTVYINLFFFRARGERDRGGDAWTLLQARPIDGIRNTSCANKCAKSIKNIRARARRYPR